MRKECRGCEEKKRLRWPKARPRYCTMRCAANAHDALPAYPSFLEFLGRKFKVGGKKIRKVYMWPSKEAS